MEAGKNHAPDRELCTALIKKIPDRTSKPETAFDRARKDKSILAMWYRLFELQHEVIKHTEPGFIKNILNAHGTRSMVDVGCGAGDLTHTISSLSGIPVDALEPEPFFFNRTMSKFSGTRTKVKFLKLPFKRYRNRTDSLFFRFVMQHFPDKTELCEHSAKLLDRDGIVIVVESFAFSSNPPVRAYLEVSRNFTKYFNREKSQHLAGDIISSFNKSGFSLANQKILKIPATTPLQKEIFAEMLYHAGYVKAMISDQDHSVLPHLREDLFSLACEEADIDYRDIILVFRKL